jgi:hypothetical protein
MCVERRRPSYASATSSFGGRSTVCEVASRGGWPTMMSVIWRTILQRAWVMHTVARLVRFTTHSSVPFSPVTSEPVASLPVNARTKVRCISSRCHMYTR